jgi:hypothetical protein
MPIATMASFATAPRSAIPPVNAALVRRLVQTPYAAKATTNASIAWPTSTAPTDSFATGTNSARRKGPATPALLLAELDFAVKATISASIALATAIVTTACSAMASKLADLTVLATSAPFHAWPARPATNQPINAWTIRTP